MTENVTDMRQQRLMEASPVEVGQVVAGKYRIDQLLALGGMGVIALAEHEVLGQRVAIKFLLASERRDESVQRFLREARAAARIQSEHVVRVYDCGKLPSGEPYMVMEHLEGVELSKEMKRRGALPHDEAVDLMLDALLGVAEAHAQGVVHRDLKPSNLFLVERPGRPRVVKVLDFGISKIQPGPDSPVGEDDLTHTSMVLGSPRYISPEQARSSKDVDVRADIWSLGVVLYQLIGGEPPFGGDTFGEILTNILLSTPPPLVAKREDLPPALGEVVMRCLVRERDGRYANVAEMAAALAPHGGAKAADKAEQVAAILGRPPPATPTEDLVDPRTDEAAGDSPTRITGSGAADESPTQGTWAQPQQRSSPRRSNVALIAGASLALVVGAGLAWRTFGASATHPTNGATDELVTEAADPARATTATTTEASPAPAETAEAAEPTTSARPDPSASASSMTPPTTPSAPPSPPPKPAPIVPPVPRPVAKPKPASPPPPTGGILDRSD